LHLRRSHVGLSFCAARDELRELIFILPNVRDYILEIMNLYKKTSVFECGSSMFDDAGHVNIVHLKVERLRGTLAPGGPSWLQPLVRGGRVSVQAVLRAAGVSSAMEVLTGERHEAQSDEVHKTRLC